MWNNYSTYMSSRLRNTTHWWTFGERRGRKISWYISHKSNGLKISSFFYFHILVFQHVSLPVSTVLTTNTWLHVDRKSDNTNRNHKVKNVTIFRLFPILFHIIRANIVWENKRFLCCFLTALSSLHCWVLCAQMCACVCVGVYVFGYMYIWIQRWALLHKICGYFALSNFCQEQTQSPRTISESVQ